MTTTIEINVEMILKFFLVFVKNDVFDKIDEQKKIKKVKGVKVSMDSPDKKIIFLGVSRRYWSLLYFIDAIVTKLLYKKINEKRNMRSFSQHDTIQFVLGSFIENKYPGLINKLRENMKNNFHQEAINIELTGMNSFFKSSGDLIDYINFELERNVRLDSEKKKMLFETIKKNIFTFSDINSFLSKGFESLLWKMVNDEECLFDETSIKLFENNINSICINEYFNIKHLYQVQSPTDNLPKKRNLEKTLGSPQKVDKPLNKKKRTLEYNGCTVELDEISEDELSETESDIVDLKMFKVDNNTLKIKSFNKESVKEQPKQKELFQKELFQKQSTQQNINQQNINPQKIVFRNVNNATINLSPNASLLNRGYGLTRIDQEIPNLPMYKQYNNLFSPPPRTNFEYIPKPNALEQMYFDYFMYREPTSYYETICSIMNNNAFKKKFTVDPNEPYPFC